MSYRAVAKADNISVVHLLNGLCFVVVVHLNAQFVDLVEHHFDVGKEATVGSDIILHICQLPEKVIASLHSNAAGTSKVATYAYA